VRLAINEIACVTLPVRPDYRATLQRCQALEELAALQLEELAEQLAAIPLEELAALPLEPIPERVA